MGTKPRGNDFLRLQPLWAADKDLQKRLAVCLGGDEWVDTSWSCWGGESCRIAGVKQVLADALLGTKPSVGAVGEAD